MRFNRVLVFTLAVAAVAACSITIPPILMRGRYVTYPGPDGSVRFEMVAEEVVPLGQIGSGPLDGGVTASPDASADGGTVDATVPVADSGTRPDASPVGDAGTADASAVLRLGMGTNVGKPYYWSGTWHQLNAWNQGRAFTDAYGALAIIPQRAGGNRVVTWSSGTLTEIHGRRPTTADQQARRFAYSVTIGTEPWGIVRGSGLLGVRDVEAAYETRSDKWHPELSRDLSDYRVLRFMDWGSTNDSSQTTWATRPQPGRDFPGESGGMAYEDMIDLSNTLGKDPWICVPHQVDDDYVRQLATLISGRLGPGRTVLIEYSNEVWNGMFSQFAYAGQRGLALGLSTNEHEARLRFVGRRTAEIAAIMRPVLGSRLIIVGAGQSSSTWVDQTVLTACGAACQALAIAPYFMAATTTSVDETIGWMRDAKGVADQFRIPLIAYEGGQHIVSSCATPNRATSMGSLYDRFLEGWRSVGGGLFVHYNDVEKFASYGCWGAVERQDVVNSPKRDALRRAAGTW